MCLAWLIQLLNHIQFHQKLLLSFESNPETFIGIAMVFCFFALFANITCVLYASPDMMTILFFSLVTVTIALQHLNSTCLLFPSMLRIPFYCSPVWKQYLSIVLQYGNNTYLLFSSMETIPFYCSPVWKQNLPLILQCGTNTSHCHPVW